MAKPDIQQQLKCHIVLWNVDQVLSNGGVLVVQRKAVYDLSGWQPVDPYHITGGKEKPSR